MKNDCLIRRKNKKYQKMRGLDLILSMASSIEDSKSKNMNGTNFVVNMK
jgi:hypothetical protein